MITKFAKFLFTGLINTIFGYSVFSIFIYLGLHYSLALLLATVTGILFNFKTIGCLVFKNNNNRLILRFIGVYLITYFLNVAAMGVLARFIANMYLTGLLVQLPLAPLSFALNYRFVFSENKCYAVH